MKSLACVLDMAEPRPNMVNISIRLIIRYQDEKHGDLFLFLIKYLVHKEQ